MKTFCTLLLLTILTLGVFATDTSTNSIKTVFLIVMENRDWDSVDKDPGTKFIHDFMLPNGALLSGYHSTIPPLRPSLPNYIYMMAGKSFGITDNLPPAYHSVPFEAVNLMKELDKKSIPWKGYMEGISGLQCPDFDFGSYAVKHNPFVYFEYVTYDPKYCISHLRPFTELFGDLEKGTVPNFVFITPDMCHDGHDCGLDVVDTWLGFVIPELQKSETYKKGGVIFLTWEEPMPSDGPVGLIALGQNVYRNFQSQKVYTHASLLKTLEEIFGIKTPLGDAENAKPFSEIFENGFGRNSHVRH